jgi:hypothetical protein
VSGTGYRAALTKHITRILLILLALAAMAATVPGATRSSTRTYRKAGQTQLEAVGQHPDWIIQNNEYYRLERSGYEGTFGITLCNNRSGGYLLPCKTGQIPKFFSVDEVANWIMHGGKGEVLLDFEGWNMTPKVERANEPHYVCFAARLAKKHHVRLITALVSPRSQAIADDVLAARCGAWAVELQIQYAKGKQAYMAAFMSFYKAIERAVHGERVIAGIGADPGGRPRTVADLWSSYLQVRKYVIGFWLNLPDWPNHPGCAPTGCVPVVEGFLDRVDRGEWASAPKPTAGTRPVTDIHRRLRRVHSADNPAQ